jgi:quercetin dioxygenase-like cupin family protein
MPKLESVEDGSTFDLDGIERELRVDGAYERNGHSARTLARTQDLRVVFMVLKDGGTIAEHHADETTSIHALSGQVRLKLPDRTVELRGGQVLVLGFGLPHDVEAMEDSSLVLTLGWPQSAVMGT